MKPYFSIEAFIDWCKSKKGQDLSNDYMEFLSERDVMMSVKVSDVFDAVKEQLNIDKSEIESPNRKRTISDARKIVSFALSGKMNQKQIGFLMGGRDHGTISIQIDSYRTLYETDRSFRKKADSVLSKFYNQS